jgi:hypothetical protein
MRSKRLGSRSSPGSEQQVVDQASFRGAAILSGRVAGCNDADVTASRAPIDLFAVANDEFARRLGLVGPDDWRRLTPCSEWDARALVNGSM